MLMPWFLVVGMAIGLAGTRTAFRARHGFHDRPRDATWFLLVLLAWLPLLCWILAQVIDQN